MDKKRLKKIMTDLAAGHITQKEADNLMKVNKVAQNKPKEQILRGNNTRKRSTKSREVK